jgi:hypothetical protein
MACFIAGELLLRPIVASRGDVAEGRAADLADRRTRARRTALRVHPRHGEVLRERAMTTARLRLVAFFSRPQAGRDSHPRSQLRNRRASSPSRSPAPSTPQPPAPQARRSQHPSLWRPRTLRHPRAILPPARPALRRIRAEPCTQQQGQRRAHDSTSREAQCRCCRRLAARRSSCRGTRATTARALAWQPPPLR